MASTVQNNINKGSKTKMTPNSGGLNPYLGSWGWSEASHLLRRTTFGPTYEQINESVKKGLDTTIGILFAPQEDPPLPINYYFLNDPEVPVGETWVGKPADINIQGLNTSRNSSLLAWTILQMLNKNVSIMEKMILFWHNHLVISDLNSPDHKYSYIMLLRKFALGNFKQLVKDMTIEPAMLLYLNGNENSAVAPNENYARELLELFTIGKGPLVNSGDYTNYTEDDVVQLARALSGWVVRNQQATFKTNRHDKGEKQLSHRFENRVINNLEEEEYKEVIDIIFDQNEVSRFISRQLYIWFVNSEINDDVELNVIEPMAQLLKENNYVIEPVIKTLLKSEHFYSECIRGSIIKSPMDFAFSLIKTGNVPIPDNNDIIRQYVYSINIYRRIFKVLEQTHFGIPSVAGWPAYYQEPVFYKIWLSSVTLPLRRELVEYFVNVNFKVGDRRVGFDLLDLVSKFEEPQDPNLLLKSFSDLFLCYDLTDEQYQFLKSEVLIPGLPDYEWTVEYVDYTNDPTNENKANAIERKLLEVINILLNLPENQMM